MSIENKCAEKLIELTPRIMNRIRIHMREIAQESSIELTVPQFRILNRLSKFSTNPSDLASWIGVSLPGISRMMEGLVLRGFVERDRSSVDRRHVSLRLSELGRKFIEEIRKEAQQRFAHKFKTLPEENRLEMFNALETLERTLFQIESDSGSRELKVFLDQPEAVHNASRSPL